MLITDWVYSFFEVVEVSNVLNFNICKANKQMLLLLLCQILSFVGGIYLLKILNVPLKQLTFSATKYLQMDLSFLPFSSL